MKRPNFFIIGAPKCGTTSLAAWLSDHPNVYMPPIKEPHFFNRDGLYATETIEEYEALFSPAGPEHLAVGEASTNYLYSEEAVQRILEYNGRARFIVSIRNPVDMAEALHAERVFQGRELVTSFEEAWRLQDERSLGKQIPWTMRKDPQRLQYASYCRLGLQLKRLYSQVPNNQVLVLLLDDIALDPRQEYLSVLNFLEVPDDARINFPAYNRRKHVRSPVVSYILQIAKEIKEGMGIRKHFGIGTWIRKLNTHPSHENSMPAYLRAELIDYYNEDIQLLEELLGRDLSGWME